MENKVFQTSYQSGDNGEYLILEGTASPIFKAYNTSEKITIKFYNTSGVKAQKLDSELFSSMKVTTSSGDTTIELNKKMASIPLAMISALTAKEKQRYSLIQKQRKVPLPNH